MKSLRSLIQNHARGLLQTAVIACFGASWLTLLIFALVSWTSQAASLQLPIFILIVVSSFLGALSAWHLRKRELRSQTLALRELQNCYDELRETQGLVIQQERMRALSQMAGGVAHKVNNSLSPILSMSEVLLKTESELSEHARKTLGHIRSSAEDVAHVMASISEFCRQRQPADRVRPVSIERLFNGVIDLTRPCWRDIPNERGITIQVSTRLEEPLPLLCCNELEVRKALTNLVLNAVDALPQGGNIMLAARIVNSALASGQVPQGGHIVLEVSDNGIGMNDLTRQHCLEPFYSTKRPGVCCGLGLGAVYGMIERHQGRILIESKVNTGTTVRLVFPAGEQLRSQDTALQSRAKPPAPLHLLCVDDEPLLRELLKQTFELYEHRVETAADGRAGLEVFQQARTRGEPFDVVITDLRMPGVDGREVAKRIKSQSPATPVVILTGWASLAEQKGEKFPCVDAVLGKPPRMADLVDTIARVTAPASR